MGSNVTRQNQIAEELQKFAEEVGDLYNLAPCGYHSIDKNGLFLRMNDTELGWLGYSREELVGKMRLSDVLTPGSQEMFRKTYDQFMRLGVLQNLEVEFVRKNGSIMPVLLSETAIKDKS